jgi:UDP-2,3-diacylglucosamine pyrophosphatase LpxH
MAGVNKAMSKINDFETIAAELAISKKYDYVICGHIHQPQKRVVKTSEGEVTYLNSGDWVENLTSLEYYQKEWKIFEYDEKDYHHSTNNDTDFPLTVLTDEISVHINSLAV